MLLAAKTKSSILRHLDKNMYTIDWSLDYTLTRSLRYGISSLFIVVHCSISWTQEFDKGHQPQRWVWTHDSHVVCRLHWSIIPVTCDLLSSGQRLQFLNLYSNIF